ncbi:fimbrial protein [Serratia sp. L9]|uniref:fimbrial protein n=1 Tax=Serratia sp. L9 TaxID=3423946 RepID=UPI003D678972
MKKKIIAALFVSVFSAYAVADDGQINFVGSITDDACTVTNNMSNPLTVTLGNVASAAFSNGSLTAAPTAFTLKLDSCPASVVTAKVVFDGTADANDNTLLALTPGADVATNVGIQLMDHNNAVVPLYTASSAYPLSAGTNDLAFVARYFATALPVTAGSANSTSSFTIVYN